MEAKLEPDEREVVSIRTKWLATCPLIIAFLCGASGCVLTVLLYYTGGSGGESPDRITRLINDVFNALFYLVPLVTAVFAIALFLTGIGLWYFIGSNKEMDKA